jgi:hypothetical protein
MNLFRPRQDLGNSIFKYNRSYKEPTVIDRRHVKLEEPTSKPKII